MCRQKNRQVGAVRICFFSAPPLFPPRALSEIILVWFSSSKTAQGSSISPIFNVLKLPRGGSHQRGSGPGPELWAGPELHKSTDDPDNSPKQMIALLLILILWTEVAPRRKPSKRLWGLPLFSHYPESWPGPEHHHPKN